MAAGQISLYIPSPINPTSAPARGTLPDGSIDVQSFDFGSSNPDNIGSYNPSTGSGVASKLAFLPLEVVIPVGPQSAVLYQANSSGAHFNTATLTIRDAAARVIETYAFKLVYVSSDIVTGGTNVPATEDVKFAVGAVQLTTFDPNTEIPATQWSWNQITNEANFNVAGITAASVSTRSSSTLHAEAVKTHVVATHPVANASTNTTIKLTAAKSHGGSTVLTARVTSPLGVPTGNVTFYSGKSELGQAAVGADGRATVTVPTAVLGQTHPFAIYSGGPSSAFQPATTIGNEAVLQKSFQKWLGRPMTQDEWVLTSMWLQEGFTPAKMATIYQSLATG